MAEAQQQLVRLNVPNQLGAKESHESLRAWETKGQVCGYNAVIPPVCDWTVVSGGGRDGRLVQYYAQYQHTGRKARLSVQLGGITKNFSGRIVTSAGFIKLVSTH